MEEVSNRTLAVLLVVAIVVSLGGTLISLDRLATIQVPAFAGVTGAAVSTGNITFTISELVEINLSTLLIDFGSGNYDEADTTVYCQLNTSPSTAEAVENCTGFTAAGSIGEFGINITNTGNVNVSLNMTCDRNAETLIGGGLGGNPPPKYNFSLTDVVESGSCLTNEGVVNGGWRMCNYNTTPATGAVLCGNFGSLSDANQLDMQWRFLIPSDAPADTAGGGNDSVQFQLLFVKNSSA